ncbi:hypothetical protein A176_006751 [Myxococcus hansupus]|uniref:Uncharacterized protein n=1 Tax=Pseudomyxococcus hansupus TaxID=1297742 RepID=A0A0H4X3R6_9BACT|nr:hypothetical protein [Myxococcus hansupus]AKQ69839.1 hypothetical protein A176_006751 [Myxococcus hansupus]
METDVNPASRLSERDYQDAPPVVRGEHAEASFTRLIEQQTAKVPSHVFLVASLAAMGVSFALEVSGRSRPSRFIGQWVSPLLVMGVYNKLVKIFGQR